MTAFYVQTALLLGAAYFLGCFLACIVRTKLVSPADSQAVASDPAAIATAAVPIARTPAVPPQPVPPPPVIAPARQPTAQPMPAPVKDAFRRADTIEPIAKPTPAAAPAPKGAASSRFEQALTNAPKANPPAATATPTPAATAQPVAPPPASSAAASAAAAAAAAAAVVAAATPRQPQQPAAPPIRVQAPSVPIPPPISQPSPAPSAAPLAPAPELTKPDDLKRIRSIDALLETALNRLGVRRYSDIARWRVEDVARVSQALGFKGRIEQENWIEQAQILSRGEDTFYSRRLARGELPSARPVSDEGERKPAPPPIAAAPAEPMRSRSGVEAAAAAAAALAAAAAASRQAAPAVAPATPTPAPIPQSQSPAPVPTAPKVEERAAFARPASEAPPISIARPAPPVYPTPALGMTAPAPTAPSATPPPPATAPATVASAPQATEATARPVIGSGRDNLQRIGGVNAEIEKALNVQGITRYSQIAHWSKVDAERIDRLLGHTGRVQRENWIEQAQILSKGGDTAYSREHDRRLAEATRRDEAAARPARLADAIRTNDARPGTDQRARSSDLSSLRSVRSEAFRPLDQSAIPPAGGRMDQTGGSPSRPGASRQTIPDDLKRIRGIGVLIEKKLNSMGITSYTQVANWSAADIERISHVLDFKGRIERENWVEQARILAAGGQTEFSRKADRDDIG